MEEGEQESFDNILIINEKYVREEEEGRFKQDDYQ